MLNSIFEVEKGEDRIALLGEKYAIKLPRSHPVRFGQYARHSFRHGGVKEVVDKWKNFGPDDHQSLKNLLFHGVVANRRESRLAKKNSNIVVPTVSILGIANIQHISQTPEIDDHAIHDSFVRNLGPAITTLGHMLEEPGNFGVSGGSVKFVDGGSRGLERLMESRPADIEQSLGSIASKLKLS